MCDTNEITYQLLYVDVCGFPETEYINKKTKRIRTEMIMHFNLVYIHDRIVMKGMNLRFCVEAYVPFND